MTKVVPHRRLTQDFIRAAEKGDWRRIGQLIDRNFEALSAAFSVETVLTGTAITTDATPQNLLAFEIPLETTVGVDLKVVARRTGGAAGAAEDGAYYQRGFAFKNVAGVATAIGLGSSPTTLEDQAAWNVTTALAGDWVTVQVTGAANNNVSWTGIARLLNVHALNS